MRPINRLIAAGRRGHGCACIAPADACHFSVTMVRNVERIGTNPYVEVVVLGANGSEVDIPLAGRHPPF
jgi:hypothetical protein